MFRTHKQMTYSVIAFTAVLFAVYSYFILNHKELYMNDDYITWMDVKEKITRKNDQHYNFLVFGDSRAKATFMPSEFDDENYNSLNLALPAGTPIESYFTLKKYLEHNEAPESILMGYSSFLLTTPYFYIRNTVKFRYLDNEDYEEIESVAEEMGDAQIIGSTDHTEYIYFTGKYLTDLYVGIRDMRWQTNKIVAERIRNSKGHVYGFDYGTGDGDSTEILLGEFKQSRIIRYYLEKLLALANEHDIDVYWYTFPINTNSYNQLTDTFLNDYQSYIDDLAGQYDFNVLSEFYPLDSRYFGDPDHLYDGAPLVTGMIKEEFLKAKEQ